MSVPDPIPEQENVSRNIGNALREAREKAGHSVPEVADRLRLSRDNIEMLEDGRFEGFPGPVFVRGYLNNYARLLGIDPGPILEEYDEGKITPPPLRAPGPARQTSLGLIFGTLAVVGFLISLSALWWWEQWGGSGETRPAGPVAESPAEPPTGAVEGRGGADAPAAAPQAASGTGDLPTAADGPPAAASRDEAPTAPAATDSGTGDLPVAADGPPAAANRDAAPAAPAADSGTGDLPVASDGPAAAANRDAAPTAPAADSGTEDLPVASDGPAAAASRDETPAASGTGDAPAAGAGDASAATDAATEAPAGEAPLVIRVREDCWLQIRDAGGGIVYSNLASAGEIIRLSGTPPLNVVAGFAQGIDITYNGEPFDITPHISSESGIARFELGP